jgi:hypothetical protein
MVFGAGTATLMIGLTAPCASAAATPAQPGDFNGDGRRDIVLGSPYGTVGSVKGGFVTVVYGGSAGPDTSKHQVVSQSSPGVPGGSEDGDRFGAALASGDFDLDGYADLAIGAPSEDSGGAPLDGGRVTIVYGGPSGLSGRAVSFTEGGRFGTSLAAGDIDGNGSADLAVGAAGDLWVYRGLATGDLSGTRTHIGTGEGETFSVKTVAADFTGDDRSDLAVSILWSPIAGDDYFTRLNVYKGTSTGLISEPIWTDGDASVSALAAGDVNDDGRADLVAGDAEGSGGGGHVRAYLATGTGFAGPQVIMQNSPDVPGTSEPGDEFGGSVGVGDVNGDGKADAVAGAPGEDLGTVQDAGAVTVLSGTRGGLTTTGALMLDQNSTGMPGSSEAGDTFGRQASLSDVTGDGRADLVIGAPGENDGGGAVWILRGSPAGITTTGATAFYSSALGVNGRNAGLGEVLLP